MTAGIFIEDYERPTTKKAVREAVKLDPRSVLIEDVTHYGLVTAEAAEIEEGEEVTFYGPDPYSDATFTGTITRHHGKLVVR